MQRRTVPCIQGFTGPCEEGICPAFPASAQAEHTRAVIDANAGGDQQVIDTAVEHNIGPLQEWAGPRCEWGPAKD